MVDSSAPASPKRKKEKKMLEKQGNDAIISFQESRIQWKSQAASWIGVWVGSSCG
jgi:hypothetical protein